MTSTTVNPQLGPFARIPNSGPGIWLVGGWGRKAPTFFEKKCSTTLHSLQNAGASCNCLQRCKVVLPFFQNMHRAPPSQGVRPGPRRAPIVILNRPRGRLRNHNCHPPPPEGEGVAAASSLPPDTRVSTSGSAPQGGARRATDGFCSLVCPLVGH